MRLCPTSKTCILYSLYISVKQMYMLYIDDITYIILYIVYTVDHLSKALHSFGMIMFVIFGGKGTPERSTSTFLPSFGSFTGCVLVTIQTLMYQLYPIMTILVISSLPNYFQPQPLGVRVLQVFTPSTLYPHATPSKGLTRSTAQSAAGCHPVCHCGCGPWAFALPSAAEHKTWPPRRRRDS